MKLTNTVLILTLLLGVAPVAIGQTTLDSAATSEILEKLVAQRPTTWLPAGTIVAKHHEYRAPDVTSSAVVDAAIQEEIQAYQNTVSKVEQSEELQKLYLDAIPFNTRYELANQYTMDSKVVLMSASELMFSTTPPMSVLWVICGDSIFMATGYPT